MPSIYSAHFPETQELVRDDPRPAYVAQVGPQAEELRAAVQRPGSSHTERRVGDLVLLLDVDPALQPTIGAIDPLEAGLVPVEQSGR